MRIIYRPIGREYIFKGEGKVKRTQIQRVVNKRPIDNTASASTVRKRFIVANTVRLRVIDRSTVARQGSSTSIE